MTTITHGGDDGTAQLARAHVREATRGHVYETI